MKSCLYCKSEAKAARGLCYKHYQRWIRYGHPLQFASGFRERIGAVRTILAWLRGASL